MLEIGPAIEGFVVPVHIKTAIAVVVYNYFGDSWALFQNEHEAAHAFAFIAKVFKCLAIELGHVWIQQHLDQPKFLRTGKHACFLPAFRLLNFAEDLLHYGIC